MRMNPYDNFLFHARILLSTYLIFRKQNLHLDFTKNSIKKSNRNKKVLNILIENNPCLYFHSRYYYSSSDALPHAIDCA